MSETIAAGDAIPRHKQITQALEAGELDRARSIINAASADDQRRIVSLLELDVREQLCELLPPEEIAGLMEHLAEPQAVEILEELPPEVAADVLEKMDAEVSGDLLRELNDEDTEAILAEIDDAGECEDLRERASYHEESAGGLMSEHVLSFPLAATVADVLRDLETNAEKYHDADVQYFFVVDENEKLAGVLSMRSLVLGARSLPVKTLMIPDPVSVSVNTSLEELEDLFEEKNYLGLPAVDEEGRLKGMVSRRAVTEALSDHQTDDYLKASGIVGGEELRSMPLKDRCLRRLAWLGPNILLNLLAASVIASYEETLAAVIALAVFLPMVSDMSGCSGNQAVAVSIRELTLGIIQPRDYLRILVKEGLLGLTNGAVLGIVLGTIAFFWKGSFYLSLVVGSALALNTVLSVILGGLIPLALKRFKADPALASGPILTTCTDMCGFFLVLNLASLAIHQL
jgi:magnesium transporter